MKKIILLITLTLFVFILPGCNRNKITYTCIEFKDSFKPSNASESDPWIEKDVLKDDYKSISLTLFKNKLTFEMKKKLKDNSESILKGSYKTNITDDGIRQYVLTYDEEAQKDPEIKVAPIEIYEIRNDEKELYLYNERNHSTSSGYKFGPILKKFKK